MKVKETGIINTLLHTVRSSYSKNIRRSVYSNVTSNTEMVTKYNFILPMTFVISSYVNISRFLGRLTVRITGVYLFENKIFSSKETEDEIMEEKFSKKL